MRTTAIMIALILASPLACAAAHDRWTSLDQAVSEAREQYNGRVISAQTRRDKGRETHNVRILTRDGQVRRLRYDAESGRRMPPRR
jgi:uncharacterized membrane protein YkoI